VLSKRIKRFYNLLEKHAVFLGKDSALEEVNNIYNEALKCENDIHLGMYALGNCDENICGCVEDVESYLGDWIED
jgi:hypothetical protein